MGEDRRFLKFIKRHDELIGCWTIALYDAVYSLTISVLLFRFDIVPCTFLESLSVCPTSNESCLWYLTFNLPVHFQPHRGREFNLRYLILELLICEYSYLESESWSGCVRARVQSRCHLSVNWNYI